MPDITARIRRHLSSGLKRTGKRSKNRIQESEITEETLF